MPGCSRPNNGDRFFLLNKTKQNKTKMKNEAQAVRERATRRGGSWGSHHPHRTTTTTTRCARRRHPSPALGGVRLDRFPVPDRIDLCGCGCAHAGMASTPSDQEATEAWPHAPEPGHTCSPSFRAAELNSFGHWRSKPNERIIMTGALLMTRGTYGCTSFLFFSKATALALA